MMRRCQYKECSVKQESFKPRDWPRTKYFSRKCGDFFFCSNHHLSYTNNEPKKYVGYLDEILH